MNYSKVMQGNLDSSWQIIIIIVIIIIIIIIILRCLRYTVILRRLKREGHHE
jgi:heme/copper-type cytochrome/quinol oxidase subunit 2